MNKRNKRERKCNEIDQVFWKELWSKSSGFEIIRIWKTGGRFV